MPHEPKGAKAKKLAWLQKQRAKKEEHVKVWMELQDPNSPRHAMIIKEMEEAQKSLDELLGKFQPAVIEIEEGVPEVIAAKGMVDTMQDLFGLLQGNVPPRQLVGKIVENMMPLVTIHLPVLVTAALESRTNISEVGRDNEPTPKSRAKPTR